MPSSPSASSTRSRPSRIWWKGKDLKSVDQPALKKAGEELAVLLQDRGAQAQAREAASRREKGMTGLVRSFASASVRPCRGRGRGDCARRRPGSRDADHQQGKRAAYRHRIERGTARSAERVVLFGTRRRQALITAQSRRPFVRLAGNLERVAPRPASVARPATSRATTTPSYSSPTCRSGPAPSTSVGRCSTPRPTTASSTRSRRRACAAPNISRPTRMTAGFRRCAISSATPSSTNSPAPNLRRRWSTRWKPTSRISLSCLTRSSAAAAA